MSSSEASPEISEPVRLMALAFDRVLDLLPSDVDRTEKRRREVALFIVDQFRLGEHDPERLSELALAALTPNGHALNAVDPAPVGDSLGKARCAEDPTGQPPSAASSSRSRTRRDRNAERTPVGHINVPPPEERDEPRPPSFGSHPPR